MNGEERECYGLGDTGSVGYLAVLCLVDGNELSKVAVMLARLIDGVGNVW